MRRRVRDHVTSFRHVEVLVNRSVSLKQVLIGAAVLVVLLGTFLAGMAYENHRIKSSFETVFGDFDDDNAFEDESEAEAAPDPVELVVDEPLKVRTSDGGELTVTLNKVEIR